MSNEFSKNKFYSYPILFILALFVLSGDPLFAAVDVSGDWEGTWTSDFSGSGGLSAHITQSGTNETFTINPYSGYKILDVTVDGVSVGVKTSYTFTSISSNHTIAATFTLKPSPQIMITPILSLLLGDDVP